MRGWWWWKKLAVAMTGGRCHRRRKMMGRGAEGGCGTEEKPCPISRVPTKSPAREQEAEIFENEAPIGLDYYSQAKKTLCERSPFDTEDAQVSTVPTLPSGLANILSRHSDSRKRQKKSHPGGSEKVRGPNIWTETEDYFRELTVDDVEQMEKLFSCGSSGSEKCFLIPGLGTVGLDNELKGDLANGFNFVNANVVVKEEIKEEGEQFMEVDSVGKEASVLHKEENDCSSSPEATALSTGLEWLLGSKGKVYLTTERPSKKRKLLGGDAGLEKLLIACPVDGVLSLCHYCGLGDKGDQLNRLIVCSSCNVAVHRRCFGVQDDVADSWSCSWCKLSNSVKSHERPCLLCPKQGGALKPVSKSGTESETGGEFTHLFCCQWIPEVYIHDTRTMEPVMNIEGIKATRRKLVCNICKVKCGACVRCSNGTCRTSFHPICAREAGHRMEIWGKFGCDDVELRAFCLKHSEDQNGTNTQQLEQLSVASSDSHLTKHQTVTPMLNKPHKFKISRKNGDKISVDLETTETDKAGNSLLHEEGLSNTRSKFRYQSECGDAQHAVGTLDRSKNEDASTPDTLNFTMILKKLIDRGKVKVKDVASEIGVSADSLASMLYDNHVVPDLHSKIVTWLRNNAHIGSLQKNLKVRIKSSLVSKDDKESVKDSDSVLVTESDVPVKSVPPRRRTKSNIKILKDNKVICSSEGKIGDGLVMDEAKSEELMTEDVDYPSKESVSVPTEKNFVESDGVHEILATNSPKCEALPTSVCDAKATKKKIRSSNVSLDNGRRR